MRLTRWMFGSSVIFASVVFLACVGDDPALEAAAGAPDAGSTDAATPPFDAAQTADAESPATDSAAPGPRLVFVSSAKVHGDFAKNGTTPWAAGDAICANEATANALSGTFVAFVSYVDANQTNYNAGSRIVDGAYYLPPSSSTNGAPTLAFESKQELFTTGPRVPLDRLANGDQVPQDENGLVAWVWTGTNSDGNASGDDCKAWTETNPDASTGALASLGDARKYGAPSAGDWAKLVTRLCDPTYQYRLYCFAK